MRHMFSIGTVILAIASSSGVSAEPHWSWHVSSDSLEDTALQHWELAKDLWDLIDYDTAIEHLELAADSQPENPELWLALASASEDAARRHSGRDALDHTETADSALNHLARLMPSDEEMRARSETLAVDVNELQANLVALLTAERELSDFRQNLLPGLAPTPQRQREASSGGERVDQFGSDGSGFYGRHPNWTNGNYNVLLRLEADRQLPRGAGRPISVSVRASQLNRPGPRSLQPREVGFGVVAPSTHEIPRRNRGWSVRRPAISGSGY